MQAGRQPIIPQKMTVAEFLQWSLAQSSGRYELYCGYVFKMPSERLRHLIVKGNIYAAMRSAISDSGLPCTALPDGATVIIDADTCYEPDAVVQCSPLGSLDGLVATNPTVVVEVQSPSSTLSDIYEKLPDYMTVVSIVHVLIVDPVKRRVLHYERRGPESEFLTRLVGATATATAALVLVNPGFTLDTAAFFDGLDQTSGADG
jgi:Uma2 family endonuclease